MLVMKIASEREDDDGNIAPQRAWKPKRQPGESVIGEQGERMVVKRGVKGVEGGVEESTINCVERRILRREPTRDYVR